MNEEKAWDFASDFTGYEAACLIAGVKPLPTEGKTDEIWPIIRHMKKSYYAGVRELTNDALQNRSGEPIIQGRLVGLMINPLKDRTPEKTHLWSIEVEDLICRYDTVYKNSALSESLDISRNTAAKLSDEEFILRYEEWDDRFDNDVLKLKRSTANEIKTWASEYVHEFDDQRFSRKELNRWLIDNNFSSKYNFLLPTQHVAAPKALSTNEKNTLLTLIGALYLSLEQKFDHNATSRLKQMVERMGVRISDDTIRSKLEEARLAIETKGGTEDILARLRKAAS
ncbi:hypothetical protein [Massilia phyllosphaerae]|uniref:hypothetical protein n=1 Tax=Massilia phyllosphaerae TaxID=3106034 RepID=UPI002B1CD36E|nr:hypothetical protein [Massilia sp. SGZ-792]